jgi:hypothetical protein
MPAKITYLSKDFASENNSTKNPSNIKKEIF